LPARSSPRQRVEPDRARVKEVAIIDQALLASAEARKLDEHAASLQAVYPKHGLLRRKDEEVLVWPGRLVRGGDGDRPQGLSLQRYKASRDESGQLWETTLRHQMRARSCR